MSLPCYLLVFCPVEPSVPTLRGQEGTPSPASRGPVLSFGLLLLTFPLFSETVSTSPHLILAWATQQPGTPPPHHLPGPLRLQTALNVTLPDPCDFFPHLPCQGPWWWAPRRGCDEWVNCQSFVPSSGYHFDIFAEMEFEFQKV